MLLTNRNKYKFSPKWAFGRERERAVIWKSQGKGVEGAHKGGRGGPAVAVKPRAPRKVSPAQSLEDNRVIWKGNCGKGTVTWEKNNGQMDQRTKYRHM